MAQPFFGRRDPEPVRSSTPATPAAGTAQPSAAAAAAAVAAAAQAPIAATPGGGSKLTVGPNIKLKGVEITDCDTLLVEGTVEATMNSRVIEIAAQGAFRGSAEIDIAEIRGQFDGNLTVRQKLVIHSTGQVTGKVRYGKLVIEEGGQLCGDLQYVATGNPTLGPSTSPGLTSSVSTAQGRVLPPASSKGLHVAS
jgi:cytoskeletal protein CcmA (bactofilin family)